MSSKTPTTLDHKKPVQTVVQINVYRYKNGKPNFLLFKRIDEDNDHFWQPMSQEIDDDDDIANALEETAEKQAGIAGLRYLGRELYKYEWFADGRRGRDIVFAGEVSPSTLVFPDLELYDTFAWMPYKEALLKLTWDGNKQALRQLMDHLEKLEAAAAEPVKPAEDKKELPKNPKESDKPEKSAGPDKSEKSEKLAEPEKTEKTDKREEQKDQSQDAPEPKREDALAALGLTVIPGQKGVYEASEHDTPDDPQHQTAQDLVEGLLTHADDEEDDGGSKGFLL